MSTHLSWVCGVCGRGWLIESLIESGSSRLCFQTVSVGEMATYQNRGHQLCMCVWRREVVAINTDRSPLIPSLYIQAALILHENALLARF